jgi:hypothetical protein
MTDDDQPVWQQCVDRAISRAVEAATKEAEASGDSRGFSVWDILDSAGLVASPDTVAYVRHMLAGIGAPNAPPIDMPPEEKISSMLKVLSVDADTEEAKNTLRTWKVLREMNERNQLRSLLLNQARKFIRDQGDGR